MARGGSRGVLLGVCILPPAILKNVFDVYNFSVVSNLFDSDKPYALSTHNQICANKMHHSFFYLVVYLSSYLEKTINALNELA